MEPQLNDSKMIVTFAKVFRPIIHSFLLPIRRISANVMDWFYEMWNCNDFQTILSRGSMLK